MQCTGAAKPGIFKWTITRRGPVIADVMCTTPAPTEIDDKEFDALKTRIESRPRLCGYYILGLVSIREFRNDDASQETILEHVIDHFDDDPTEPDPNFVPDHDGSTMRPTMIVRVLMPSIRWLAARKSATHDTQ